MRILVAEDDLICQRLVTRVLRSMNHEPVVTANGQEAWEAFRQQPFPVVVTDWLMPEMDGLELTRRIREMRTRGYTWIIMLTAMEFGSNYRRTMETGVDDFLTKPLDHELLRVRLNVAERVQHMSEQVRALASALPICMHCKSVRDAGDTWRRVEEYFRDIDFSHGYCPDCYFEHSLRQELERLPPAADPDPRQRLDAAALERLLAFERDESPGLFDELAESVQRAGPPLRASLDAYRQSGLLDDRSREQLQRCRRQWAVLGGGRLVSALDAVLETLPPGRLSDHGAAGLAACEELDATLDALALETRGERRPS
jgi:CheY-like chemotaxis protein